MKTLVRDKVTGDSRVWVHGQTLDKAGRKWRHGRVWLFFGPTERRRALGVSWKHGGCDKTFGVSLRTRHFDNLISISVWFPFLFHWTVFYESGCRYFDQERELSLRAFCGKLWWWLWMPVDEWHSDDPRWRRGWWSPIDTLLGKETYSRVELETGTVMVPMPEGSYLATYKAFRAEWKRARWPFPRRAKRFDLDMVTPIPGPGKGENSWDMGDDATYGVSLHCDSLNEAVGRLRASVLRQREQYGGPNWQPAPTGGEA